MRGTERRESFEGPGLIVGATPAEWATSNDRDVASPLRKANPVEEKNLNARSSFW